MEEVSQGSVWQKWPRFAAVRVDSSGTAASDTRALLRRAIGKARCYLLGQQHPQGFWQAELEGDSILESETILILTFFGRRKDAKVKQLAAHILEAQNEEGGWSLYPGGPSDISASVKAYFALKLAGQPLDSEPLRRARDLICRLGGAERVNSFTRFYLAFLGQIPYTACPAVPPELVLAPQWWPVNLYALSAWSRTMVVPLSIIWALKPVRQIPCELGIRELMLTRPENWQLTRGSGAQSANDFWSVIFCRFDRFYKFLDRHGCVPFRRRALKAAERWMLEHLKGSDGLGAIYPAMMWSLIAFHALGYKDQSPVMTDGWKQIDALFLTDQTHSKAWVQPCLSPVWDTAITIRTLSESGIGLEDPGLLKAARWLLDQQIHTPGDWAKTVDAEPGGWCFQHANAFYPDCDDTAAALLALSGLYEAPTERAVVRARPYRPTMPHEEDPDSNSVDEPNAFSSEDQDKHTLKEEILTRSVEAIRRGLNWLLAMQSADGGWAAFDRDNCRQFLTRVPFADHNAMIDPSSPDVTGRVLEALGRLGYRVGNMAVDRAVRYLRSVQEPDGSWLGRWGVSYIYGTWLALSGLRAVGVSENAPEVVAGVNWLIGHQLPDGGWGETPETYDNPARRGAGPSTPSQTAWAILGLIAAGKSRHPAVLRGIRYLLTHQNAEGIWEEKAFTGTGFPRVFYLRYHFYPVYFPLLALVRFAEENKARLQRLVLPELSPSEQPATRLNNRLRSA